MYRSCPLNITWPSQVWRVLQWCFAYLLTCFWSLQKPKMSLYNMDKINRLQYSDGQLQVPHTMSIPEHHPALSLSAFNVLIQKPVILCETSRHIMPYLAYWYMDTLVASPTMNRQHWACVNGLKQMSTNKCPTVSPETCWQKHSQNHIRLMSTVNTIPYHATG